MRKAIFRCFLLMIFLGLSLTFSEVSAQTPTPQVMEQIRSGLTSKGLTEEEVKLRLRSRGIDIDKMTQEELIENRGIIEQTVNEMEAEKKANVGEKKLAPPVEAKPLENIQESIEEVLTDKAQGILADSLPTSSIYGHKVFRENSLAIYRVSKDASPPESYVLGPGDKINILIFGKAQADLQYEINEAGFISPATMPKIFLSGLTLKQAKEMLIARFSRFYAFNSDQFALTLNTSRTLTVNIFGEVERQGSYTTSALNTALNALSVSGGPTEFGSVRNIQIIRGKSKKILDVYAFMRNPIKQFDFYLQNNDIIYVPVAEKIVKIEGAVNRPMRYELTEEEGMKELLEYAGGLKIDAYSNFVQVHGYENNSIVIRDYDLAEVLKGKSKLVFKNGDIITIRAINNPLKSFVQINGAVRYGGGYELKTTKSLKALLQKAILMPEAKTDQAFIIRKLIDKSTMILAVSIDSIQAGTSKDLELQSEDEIIVYDKAGFTELFKVAVLGEVRAPFERNFNYNGRISIQEAINLAGGLKPAAAEFAYIYRTDPFKTKRTEYISINLPQTMNEILLPGDRLIILNKDLYERESSISIGGDVRTPVQLRFDSSLSIKDLITIAGGLTISSDYTKIEVFRLNFEFSKTPVRILLKLSVDKEFNLTGNSVDFRLQPFDMVVVRTISDFKMQETARISGEIKSAGPYYLRRSKYHFSDLIKDAGGFLEEADVYNISLVRYADNSGLIVFNAEEALNNKRKLKKDPILWPGDYISVPRLSNTVKIDPVGTNYVLGANQNALQITYQGNMSAAKYVRNYAGGFVKEADLKTLRVTSGNGGVRATKRFLFFKIYPEVHPGDRITVSVRPPEEVRKKREIKPFDTDKFVSRLLAVFTTLALVNAYVN